MLKEDAVESDIRQHKIKEGFLMKRSRILKQWKKRWMVLTRTHLYSFEMEGAYRNPTEKIPLRDVSTIKSYYKNQYQRPNIIRIESEDTYFYLSAKEHQEKWSWMTAIERTTDQISHPVQDSQNLIRETLRMSTALRQSTLVFGQRQSTINILPRDIPSNLMTKLKLCITKRVVDQKYIPTGSKKNNLLKLSIFDHITLQQQKIEAQIKRYIENEPAQQVTSKSSKQSMIELTQESVSKVAEEGVQKIAQQLEQVQKIVYKNVLENKVSQEKIIEKIIEVKVIEKIIEIKEVEKIVEVRVPFEVRVEIEVERVVQVQKIVLINKDTPGGNLIELFTELISCKLQDPKPLLDFVSFLGMCGVEKYQGIALQFCCQHECHRFFAELLLQALNQEVSEQRLNRYTSFIYIICQRQTDYFYASDLRILTEIVLRELQLNRSQMNQLVNLHLLRVLITYHINSLSHRRNDIWAIVNEITCLGSMQSKQIGQQICFLLQ